MSWLWRINLKTNISLSSQFIHLYVPKICPFLGFYAAFIVTLLKKFRENISAPILSVKHPKNNVVEVIGCLLKQYVRYLRCLYLIQIKLTLSRTNICVDETAITSYVNKISILLFHTFEDLLCLPPQKKISRSLPRSVLFCLCHCCYA